MKKEILLAAVILLSTVCFTQAQDELSGTIDVTYLSAYTWYGIDMYRGAHGEGAIQSTLDLDLYDTGLGLGVKWIRANTAGVDRPGAATGTTSFEDGEELWLTLS